MGWKGARGREVGVFRSEIGNLRSYGVFIVLYKNNKV